jgi:hypothetical protein
MEVHMLKAALIVAATAVVCFATGFWTESTMARQPTFAATGFPATISPAEMQLNVKPSDLPVQYMEADYI